MDAICRIEKLYNKMSKGQKAIADYVLKNYDKAAFMNVGQLSEKTGVSEATVVRFSAEIGFDKYQSFLKSLREYAKSKLTSLQRIDLTYDRMNSENILSSVLNSDISNIKNTLTGIEPESFNKAVDSIAKAENIYILGLRSANALANFLGFYLNLMFKNVNVVCSFSASEIFEQMFRIGENDTVIGISFPRYSKRTINALKYAKTKNAKIIAITDGPESPISANADYSLYARSEMVSFADSLVAPLSVINALIVALGAKKKTQIYENFKNLEKIWHDYEVYDDAENN